MLLQVLELGCQSRQMRLARNVKLTGEMRNEYNILVRIPEGKKPLGRPRRRWEDSTRMDVWEIG